MIKCPFCAFDNPDDNAFCTSCGRSLAPPPPPPAPPPPPQPPPSAAAQAAEAGPRFCTECGAKIPAESNFCTACGRAFGATGTPGAAPSAQDYLTVLDARLSQNGFETVEPPAGLGLDRFLRRKKFELAQIGMVTAFCGIKVLDGPAGVTVVKDFSKAVFDASGAGVKKGPFGRNPLQQILVYPVLVVPSVEADVASFINGHWPKHWMSYEFAVVVSLGTREVLMPRGTPLWQPMSHAGFKKQAESLFAI